jgi:PAS domain S-box-containing protein
VNSHSAQRDHKADELPRLAYRFRQASQVIALLVATLGLVVLCGWAFHVPVLTYIRPEFQSMKVNTALSFLCLGAGLWLARSDKWQRRRFLGLLVVGIAGLTLAEYAFHVSLGIDQLFFPDTRTPSAFANPGRMAVATATCFLLLGLAVTLLGSKKAVTLQRSLVAACFILSLVAVCGYLYGVYSLYSITAYSTVAVHTAAGMMAACMAYFLSQPDQGIVSIAASETNSGLLLRTVVPAIIVVPIVIGWLRLAGQRAGLYDTSFGVALQVIGSIVCLTALTLVVARSMNRLEREHSRAEQAQLRWTALIESTDDAIAALDMNGTITNWNKGAECLFGYSASEAIGQSILFLSPADAHDDAKRLLSKVWQGEAVKQHETVRRRKDGTSVDISLTVSPIVDSQGRQIGTSGIARDISKRKRAEEALWKVNRTLEMQAAALRSREELLRVFVKNVPAPVAMLDRDMRYLQVSDRWCTDYLSGRTEVLGRSHYEIFPDMPERWKEVHRRALQGETLRADEDRWDGQDGSHWARWEVRSWKTAEGAVGGILILAEDITRRKQMEESLSDLSRRLIESQEQERARIGRELHDDINQRLAMLALELEQLPENPSEVRNRVRALRKEMLELSNDVQALSHELHSSRLEYLGVVAGIQSWTREFGERHRMEIGFKSDVSSVLPFEVGVCLFRVLQEALHNASKHSGVKRVAVQIEEHSNEVHLIVNDSGKGFDVEMAKQGHGLGLTSMRERVRLVNGTMSIESKPMGGATIHVCVPLESKHAAKREAV